MKRRLNATCMAVMVLSMALAALTNGTRPARADLPLVVPPGLEPAPVPPPYTQPNGLLCTAYQAVQPDPYTMIVVGTGHDAGTGSWIWSFQSPTQGSGIVMLTKVNNVWQIDSMMWRPDGRVYRLFGNWVPGNKRYDGKELVNGAEGVTVDFIINVGDDIPPG